MQSQVLKIHPLCTDKVNFYTIKFDDKSVSEFTDFNKRLSVDIKNTDELDEIFSVLEEIGDRGAIKRYFNREENDAAALPPKGEEFFIEGEGYGLRLYCVVLSPGVVFLLNGDRKFKLKATEAGSNVSRYFYMANSLFRELIKDRMSKYISWDEYDLYFDDPYYINVQG